jgi:hypothetical protein
LHTAHYREREVGVQAALVVLVEDHAAHSFEQRVLLEPAHEDALGDEQHAGPAAVHAFEANLVADFLAELEALLFRHAPGRRERGDSSRLEHHHPALETGHCRDGWRTRVVLPAPGGAVRTALPPCRSAESRAGSVSSTGSQGFGIVWPR